VITWYKDGRILSAGGLKIAPDAPRVVVDQDARGRGVDLRLKDVRPVDEGEYKCEANLKDRVVNITHQLEVLGKSFWTYGLSFMLRNS